MTFEEWKEKHNDLIENVAITFFNYGKGVDTKTCYDELEYLLKRAFKAGRLKWHDLRKDPNDLPKVNQKVLLQIKDEGRPIIDFYTRYGVWNFTNEYEAIAWCEIPKYMGE